MQSVLARRLRHSREALQQSMSSGAPFFRRVESIFCRMQINGLQIIRDPFSKKIIELIHDFRSDRQVLRVSNSGSQQIGSLPGVREKTFEMAQIFLRVASAKVHRQLSRVIEIIRQRAKVVQLVHAKPPQMERPESARAKTGCDSRCAWKLTRCRASIVRRAHPGAPDSRARSR